MKPAFIAAMVLAATINFAPGGEAQQRPNTIQEGTQTEAHPDGRIPTSPNNNTNCATARTDPANTQPPRWYRSPEWVLVIVGIATCFVIGWQSWATSQAANATRDSAKAAERSADAQINSERAWVIAELVPMAAKYDGQWHRIEPYGPVAMSPAEILAGYHWKYKLKLTNMGRTPAQIFGFDIRYSCLGEGIRDLPESAGGNHASYRPFEHLLGGGGQAIEIEEPIVDVGRDMQDDMGPIYKNERTAVFYGTVKYRHMFSTTNDCYADFCYVYTVSQERLTSVGRHTKQRQQMAN